MIMPDELDKFFFTTGATFLFLLVLTATYGQGALGIGVVEIEFNTSTIINFYNKPTDKTCAKRIEFFHDKAINSPNIKDLNRHAAWLKPQTFWLDYFQFNFRCKSVSNGWLEVINGENSQTFWIKRNEVAKFVTWEEFLLKMFSVERRKDEVQEIRVHPTDTADKIEYEGSDCFKVKSFQGDWMEISTTDYCNEGKKKVEIKSGWIRWRRGDKLLIRYYATS